jgi:hypothetical protein
MHNENSAANRRGQKSSNSSRFGLDVALPMRATCSQRMFFSTLVISQSFK